MKKTPTYRSAFLDLNPRVLISFVFFGAVSARRLSAVATACYARNVLLALLAFALHPSGNALAASRPQQNQLALPALAQDSATEAIVSLPTAIIETSVTNFIHPVVTSTISPADHLVAFQGDFTFDSTVVTFQDRPVSNAEMTADNWNVIGNVLPGAGPIRTLRISAFSSNLAPLSGTGTLFNLNMIRLSSIPQASTALTWAAAPDDFVFIDIDLESHAPGSTQSGSITIVPAMVATVSLPAAAIDTSLTNFAQPVVTSVINAPDRLVAFQGDFTFDSTVINFQNPPVSNAGMTAGNWNVSGNVLPGAGPIRTLRISAFANDLAPLSGVGVLFNLNMIRVSSIPQASTALTWAAGPDDFIFIDYDLEIRTPGSTQSGTITISPILVATVSLPAATIDPSLTNFTQPVATSAINPAGHLIGFQGDFTFDSTVVSFQDPPVSSAGTTGDNWNVSGNVLPGPGPIRTLRISAFANDGNTPLSGAGTLFNLNMTRVSSTSGASTALIWAAPPDNLVFFDDNLDPHVPGSTPPGSLTIEATAINISGNISCPNANPGPVPNVTLILTGSTSGSTLSDGSGNYMSPSLVPGGSYTVTPTKSALAPGSTSVDTVDSIATWEHFLGVHFLTGWRLTAADVNGDTFVDTVDVIAIQRFFLGLSTGTANVGKYQFSPASRTYPETVIDQTGQDYDTLIFGDVAAPFAER